MLMLLSTYLLWLHSCQNIEDATTLRALDHDDKCLTAMQFAPKLIRLSTWDPV